MGLGQNTQFDVVNMCIGLGTSARNIGTFIVAPDGGIHFHFDTIKPSYVTGTAVFYAQ